MAEKKIRSHGRSHPSLRINRIYNINLCAHMAQKKKIRSHGTRHPS